MQAMKFPPVCQPASPSRRVPRTKPVASPPVAFSYTYGRLRPRFVTQGAWHELWCLVSDLAPPPMGTDEFEHALVKALGPGPDGALPSGFGLARELVWPLEDVLGLPQCLVRPRSDEEITELLEALQLRGPHPAPFSIVRGVLSGFGAGVGTLDGVPEVDLVSALPFVFEADGRFGRGDPRESLFGSYQPLLANNGIGDELRAVNFILTQSAAFYELAARLEHNGCGGSQPENRLVSMQAVPVNGPRSRSEVDVVFSFQSLASGAVEHWFQRVDVGGAFMFLVTEEVQPYFRRPAETVVPQAVGDVMPQVGEEQATAGVLPQGLTSVSSQQGVAGVEESATDRVVVMSNPGGTANETVREASETLVVPAAAATANATLARMERMIEIACQTLGTDTASRLGRSEWGWEKWLQSELWAEYSRELGAGVLREQQIPDQGTTQLADIVVPESGAAGAIWMEIKVGAIGQPGTTTKSTGEGGAHGFSQTFTGAVSQDGARLKRVPGEVGTLQFVAVPFVVQPTQTQLSNAGLSNVLWNEAKAKSGVKKGVTFCGDIRLYIVETNRAP